MTLMWITAALVFVRMNALLMALPVFSTTGVPKYVGIMLSVALTFLIAPGVPP
ncbi:MAG: flagellar biosynthetic protein FliR, partial [Kiritimatiellia bacterium]